MGAFRDFFTGLWNTYIGTKLDAITGKFKTEIGDKIALVTSGISGVKTYLDTKIGMPIKTALDAVTTKIGVVKDAIDKIPTSVSELKTGLTSIKNVIGDINDFFAPAISGTSSIWDWIQGNFFVSKKWFYIQTIKQFHSVSKLEKGWLTMPTDITSDKDVIACMEDRKESLAAEGYNTPVDHILNPFAKGIQCGVKAVTDAALVNIQEVLDDVYDAEDFPQETRAKVNKLAASGEFGLNAVVGFMLGHFLSPVLSTSLAPAWEGMAQEAWKILPVKNVDPATLIRLKYKGMLGDLDFDDIMKQHGYDAPVQKAMIDDFVWLPTVGDVIRWSTREAFLDDYALKYGLDKEYPDKLDVYGPKLGIAEQELTYFWRSHWELPSVMMGYEMLHRTRSTPMYPGQKPSGSVDDVPYYTVISDTDLENLFMAADIMPFWRDKLKAISYHPYTRVDVRRLYKTGVIDRAAVKKNYLDLGYDEEKAENITEFTVRDTLAKERDLTRSHIERLYKEGQLTTEMTITHLCSLGYDEEESKLLIMLIDLKLEDAMDKDLIATWTAQFKLHLIDLKTLTANLDTLNVTLEKKNRLLARAQLVEVGFVTLPSKEDLTKWYAADIISKEIFMTRMAGLGYLKVDIDKYILQLAK